MLIKCEGAKCNTLNSGLHKTNIKPIFLYTFLVLETCYFHFIYSIGLLDKFLKLLISWFLSWYHVVNKKYYFNCHKETHTHTHTHMYTCVLSKENYDIDVSLNRVTSTFPKV